MGNFIVKLLFSIITGFGWLVITWMIVVCLVKFWET